MDATHLLIHRYRPGTGPAEGTGEHDDEMRRWSQIDAELRSTGTLVEAYALQDAGARVVGPDGTGSLNTTEEIVFAIHAVAVADDDAAHRLATAMPHVTYGTTEIRRLMPVPH